VSAPGEQLLRLDDYAAGDMPDAEAARLEEELFAAAADADPPAGMRRDASDGLASDAAFVARLVRMAIDANASGVFAGGATRAQIDALLASGLPVHYVDLGAAGEKVFAAWDPATVKVVVARLAVDLRGWTDIEVEVTAPDGRPVKTFRDVTCAPEDGALYAVCHEPLARLAFTKHSVARIVAARDGRRETVAVYDVRPPG
jgi:hypothetical protein